MNLTTEQLARRAEALMADEVLIDVIDQLKKDRVSLFEGTGASQAEVEQARHGLWALNEIHARLQALVDDQKFVARRQR